MKKKLTLRMEEEQIQKLKQYAAENGHSVSALVADFAEKVVEKPDESKKFSSITESLIGIIPYDGDIDPKTEYREYLEEKYKK